MIGIWVGIVAIAGLCNVACSRIFTKRLPGVCYAVTIAIGIGVVNYSESFIGCAVAVVVNTIADFRSVVMYIRVSIVTIPMAGVIAVAIHVSAKGSDLNRIIFGFPDIDSTRILD